MQSRALKVLACPECFLPFAEVTHASGAHDRGILRCGQGHEFEVAGGVPMLVRESDRPRLRAFADSYGLAWAKDGWGSPDITYLASLPFRDVTRRRTIEWKLKARSMVALLGALDPHERPCVFDLGCGNGWLSHQLAIRGHDVYALDVALDDVVGLGAAGAYVRLGPPFQRVWADLERLPIQSSSTDAVVCNASLHYVHDIRAALQNIARVLRSGGLLAILNSPVHSSQTSAARAQADFRARLRGLGASHEVVSTYRHFVRSELISDVFAAVGPVEEVRFGSGLRFRWSRRLKSLALQMELASFPILIATKRQESAPRAVSPGASLKI